MKLTHAQRNMLDMTGEEWKDIPHLFNNITRTSEAVRDRSLIELRRNPEKNCYVQARRAPVAEAVRP